MPCSQTALGESMAGTAPQTRVWIAVEHPGPWSSHAVADYLGPGSLPPGVRVVLIRRDRVSTGRVFCADLQRRRISMLRDAMPSDIWDIARIAEGDLPGEPYDGNMLLVCTNGRRDQCCATQGRALLHTPGLPLWEATHLGGHRFAPVVLRLPDGFMFGRVDQPALRSIATGGVPHGHGRGRSSLTPPEQAAELAVHEAGFTVQRVFQDSSDHMIAVETSQGLHRVRVVRETQGLLRPESCGGPSEPTSVWHCLIEGVD